MNITTDAILKELGSGDFKPLYLFMGDEPYYIDLATNYIEKNAIDEAQRDFNQTIFYGKDTNVLRVFEEATSYPVFSEKRVVIVKEAQEMKDINKLENYVGNLLESTILVICYKYKALDKRGKLYKSIDKKGIVMESKKLYDYQMTTWISQFITKQKLQITSQATEMLAEALGTNISSLVSTIERLRIAIPDLKEITPEIVDKYVGISKEYNTFELRDAIFSKNINKVNKIVNNFSKNNNQNPLQPIIAMLFNAFEKLFAYYYLPDKNPAIAAERLGEKPFVIQRLYQTGAMHYNARKCLEIINILRTYDVRSKGYAYPSRTSGELLQEMVFRIVTK